MGIGNRRFKPSPMDLPEGFLEQLTAADKAKGFPAGTMQSILMQEVGGNPEYLTRPDTYHYGTAPNRKSSATGPFGILRSTGGDPGGGVSPLTDWKNLNEHTRFAADYLALRVKQAGSFAGGLKGYGDGTDKYVNSVMGRLGPTTTTTPQPAAQNQAGFIPVARPATANPVAQDWSNFQQAMPRQQEQAPLTSLASYGQQTPVDYSLRADKPWQVMLG